MKLYADSSLNVTEEIKVQKAFDDETFEIEQILEMDAERKKCLIKWRGFSHAENSWEDVTLIQQDAPKVLEEFLKTLPPLQKQPQAKRRRRR